MAVQTIVFRNWSGGLSDDQKFGTAPNMFAEGTNSVDFRTQASLLKLNRQSVKESSTTVDTPVLDAVRVANGDIFLAGETKLYKRAAAADAGQGTYSAPVTSTFSNVYDLDYIKDLDTIYCIDKTSIHSYYPISGSPSLSANTFTDYLVSSIDNSGSSYTLPTSISESALKSFIADADPITAIGVEVNAKGTGNWTLTLHDATNTLIASATILNASVPASGFVDFTFSTPARVRKGFTYHIHLTVSTGTSSVVSTAPGDLSTASFRYYTSRLIQTANYVGHPVLQVGNKSLIGNERYLAEVEWGVTFDSDRLTFPADQVVIGLAQYNEYTAIATARLSNADGTAQANPYGSGYIYLWDNVSVFYNFVIEIPDGAPFSLTSHKNILFWEAAGRLQRWAGGDIETIYEFPGVSDFSGSADPPKVDFFLRTHRGGAVYRNLLHVGYPFESANLNTDIGIYTYGQMKGTMPIAVGYDYKASHGQTAPRFNTSTTPDSPRTGYFMLKSFGSFLLASWRDYNSGDVYGVDFISQSNTRATSARYISTIVDGEKPHKEKTALKISIKCNSLPADATITPFIINDRAGSITEQGVLADVTIGDNGDVDINFPIKSEYCRFYECQVGFDIATTSGANVEVVSMAFEYDDNEAEQAD